MLQFAVKEAILCRDIAHKKSFNLYRKEPDIRGRCEMIITFFRDLADPRTADNPAMLLVATVFLLAIAIANIWGYFKDFQNSRSQTGGKKKWNSAKI